MFIFAGGKPEEVEAYTNDHLARLQHTLAMVKKHTPAQGKILDIGAKPFVLTSMLMEAHYNYTGIGVYSGEKDLRHDAVAACSISPSSNQAFEIELGDGHKKFTVPLYETNIELNEWPFTNGSFDTLIWTETLEHLTSDPSFAWQQANKVLKLGGKLIFSVPNALYWIRAVQLLFGKNIDDPYSWHGPFGRHNRLYTSTEIINLANLHGFKVTEISTRTFLGNKLSVVKKLFRSLINILSLPFGKRKGRTIIAVFEKISESEEVKRPSFLYH